ncbi:MAG: transglutaminase domain-containing protein [Marinoscillum sp.]
MNKGVFLGFLWLAGLATYAQKPDEVLLSYTSKYPLNNAVQLVKSEVIDLSIQGDSLVANSDVYEEIIYLSDNPSGYSRERIYSSGFTRVDNIEAYSLIPGKRKYDQLKVENMKDSYEMESFVFYDDGREITFNYPSLVKGSKSTLKYKRHYLDTRIINMFFFQSYLPIERAEYKIVYDPQIEVAAEIFNDPKGLVEVKRATTKDGRKEISCVVHNAPKIKLDHNSPSYQSIVPTAHFRVNSYQVKGKNNKVLSDVGDLHGWYSTFIAGLNQPDTTITQLVEKLVNDKDTDLDKLKSIYYWVQENIRYIAFEDGMRGFIPHAGGYVLEKRYGDCKDMSSILVDLLRAAGLSAYHTWIGTRDIPYGYRDTPTPIVDNHMIATCSIDDKWYFLDATGSYTPLGLPTSMIQGKECLVSKGESYELVSVPVIPASENVMRDSVSFRIENGKVTGSGEVKLTGYAKVFNNYRLIKSSKKEVDDYVHRLLGKGSNKFLVDNYKLTGTKDLDVPTFISYDFNIKDYYNEVGDKIYVNLILDQSILDDLIENREVPIENEYLYTNESISVLQIPDGSTLEYLPDDEGEETEFFTYSIKYAQDGNNVIATKTFTVNYLTLGVDQFDEWNKVIKKYSKACRNALVLNKTNN